MATTTTKAPEVTTTEAKVFLKLSKNEKFDFKNACHMICGRNNAGQSRNCQMVCARIAQACHMQCGRMAKGRAARKVSLIVFILSISS